MIAITLFKVHCIDRKPFYHATYSWRLFKEREQLEIHVGVDVELPEKCASARRQPRSANERTCLQRKLSRLRGVSFVDSECQRGIGDKAFNDFIGELWWDVLGTCHGEGEVSVCSSDEFHSIIPFIRQRLKNNRGVVTCFRSEGRSKEELRVLVFGRCPPADGGDDGTSETR